MKTEYLPHSTVVWVTVAGVQHSPTRELVQQSGTGHHCAGLTLHQVQPLEAGQAIALARHSAIRKTIRAELGSLLGHILAPSCQSSLLN